MAKNKRLGELLVEWGVINPKQVTSALDHAKAKEVLDGQTVVDVTAG